MTRTYLIRFFAVVGVVCVLLAPAILAGELGERFDHSDAIEIQRQASIESCERQNDIREAVRGMVLQSQDNLESLRHELFNISREEFDALVAERREQARETAAQLRERDCVEEYMP